MGQQPAALRGCAPSTDCRPDPETAYACQDACKSFANEMDVCGAGESEGKKKARALLNQSLLKASQDGDAIGVKEALSQNAFIEVRRPFVVTPETSAGGVPQIKYNERGHGFTPLMHAAKGGYLPVLELLVFAKANLESQDEDGIRPLHCAAMSGDLDVVKMLLKAGADPNAEDDEGRACLEHVPAAVVSTAKERRVWEDALKQGGGGLCGMSKAPNAAP